LVGVIGMSFYGSGIADSEVRNGTRFNAFLQQLILLLLLRPREDGHEFDETMEAKVAALSAEEVNAAFRKHVDAASLGVVRVGDFKKAGVLQ
jgi:hypothetical protein